MLVIAARDEDKMPRKAFQGLDCRIGIRRLGIVVIRNAIDDRYGLNAVFHTAKALEHLDHACRRCSGQIGHRGGREGILHIVAALDLQLIHPAELRRLSLPADGQYTILDKSALRQSLLTAEKENRTGSTLRHRTGMGVIIIEHKIIVLRLLRKQLFLHLLVDLQRPVAYHVVRRHIEHRSDLRMEIMGCLQLITGNLRHHTALTADAHDLITEWNANIAAYADLLVQRLHEQSQQRHRRCLAIGSGYSIDRCLGETPGQLDFADDLDAALHRLLYQRNGDRHRRRNEYRVHAVKQRKILLAALQLHPAVTQWLQVVFDIRFLFCIAQNDGGSELYCQFGSGKAANAGPDDQQLFIDKFHVISPSLS